MDFVRQSYSDIAQGKQDTILSSSPDQQALNVSVGYSEEEISLVPPAANMGLGCGNPFRIVEVKEGDTLIDLGSGAGSTASLPRTRWAEKAGSSASI